MSSTPFPRAVDQHPVRIDQIMITRFLVALTMLFFHYGRNICPLNTNVIGPVALAAPVWVSYFFVLSGFLMAYVYCKSGVTCMNATRYWTSRFARVVPIYWLALAAAWMIQDDPLHSDPVALVLSVTLLQAWVPGYPLTLNYPGWAVSVQSRCVEQPLRHSIDRYFTTPHILLQREHL